MNFLLDTNIVSEIAKGRRCDAHVAAWFASVDESSLYLSVLVLGEIRKGVESLRPCDPPKAQQIEKWLGEVTSTFAERVLPVSLAVSDAWGRISALRTVPVVDGLLAATANVHRMVLVSRNEAHVKGLGVKHVNPFRPAH